MKAEHSIKLRKTKNEVQWNSFEVIINLIYVKFKSAGIFVNILEGHVVCIKSYSWFYKYFYNNKQIETNDTIPHKFFCQFCRLKAALTLLN